MCARRRIIPHRCLVGIGAALEPGQDFGRGGVALEPTLDRALWTAEEDREPSG